MFRQLRTGAWVEPISLTGQPNMGFGLCAGTAAYGKPTNPNHFLGVRARKTAAWTRATNALHWNTGYQVFSRAGAVETVHGSGSAGVLKVALAEEETTSAWYMRLTRLGASLMRVTLFLPSVPAEITRRDFLTQLSKPVWLSSVNNHSGYQEIEMDVSANEGLLGELDNINIFSDLKASRSNNLKGIDWSFVRAERIRP